MVKFHSNNLPYPLFATEGKQKRKLDIVKIPAMTPCIGTASIVYQCSMFFIALFLGELL